MRKHKADAKTLKDTKDKVEKEACEAFMRSDATIRRAENVKVAIQLLINLSITL